MMRLLPLLLCAWFLLPSLVAADEPARDAQWHATLRNSGSYKTGMNQVREKIEFAYDRGAVNGASRWETIHGYYLELARAKGCKTGVPFADGPVKACHQVSTVEPKLLGPTYSQGREEIIALSMDSVYPALVRKVLFVIYDYGYVQGVKHGLRKYNDDLVWAQTYYKSCVERANDAAHEPACAEASKGRQEVEVTNGRERPRPQALSRSDSASRPGADDCNRGGVRGGLLHFAPECLAGTL
jgi:hypothetical protein